MNKVFIGITKCQHCTNFHYGEGHGEDHCDHPDAPYSGECTGNGSIPDECPRMADFWEDQRLKPVVIILNGYPTSGKDTFCEFAHEGYNVHEYSTVDTVKDIAVVMGWNNEKTPQNRDMLSALKDFYVKWFDGTFNEMTDLIEEEYRVIDNEFVFLHTREPEEIARIANWCEENNIKARTVFINRDVETKHGNHADANVSQYDYDIYVDNDGTLEEFKEKSLDIFAKIVDNRL